MSTDQQLGTDARPKQEGRRTFFGHPWGLANLAGVEMWERFSFYGMQAILVYYLYYSVTDGGSVSPKRPRPRSSVPTEDWSTSAPSWAPG